MWRIGGRHGLFACGLADSRGHAALAQEAAGGFVHAVGLALGHALVVHLGPPALWPIRDVWHAERVLGYVHRQDEHRGVEADPLREGTTSPALFGLRVDLLGQ